MSIQKRSGKLLYTTVQKFDLKKKKKKLYFYSARIDVKLIKNESENL